MERHLSKVNDNDKVKSKISKGQITTSKSVGWNNINDKGNYKLDREKNKDKVLGKSKHLLGIRSSKSLAILILLTGNCCWATEQWKEADVLFNVQKTTDGLTLVGEEKGKSSFSLNLNSSNLKTFTEYTEGNFSVTKLANELKWRYVRQSTGIKPIMYYAITVKLGGDIELPSSPLYNTPLYNIYNNGVYNNSNSSGDNSSNNSKEYYYTGYDNYKTFGIKTEGTIVNRGNQAFYRLLLEGKEIHNYGTIQTGSYYFCYDYGFNRGVIKSGEIPKNVEDLVTERLKEATKDRKPEYKEGISENYGQKISVNKRGLKIGEGLSYHERGESAIKKLEMGGGDIKVINGSMNIEEELRGEVRNIEVTGTGSLYAGKYEVKKNGRWLILGNGDIYTSDKNAKEINNKVEELNKEQNILEKIRTVDSKRVTKGEAYWRYTKIKEGKENELYDRLTIERIKREHKEHWIEVATFNLNGLKGGGNDFDGAEVVSGIFFCAFGIMTGGAGFALAPAAGGAIFSGGVGMIMHGSNTRRPYNINFGYTRTFNDNPFDRNGSNHFAVGPTQESVNHQIHEQRQREEEERKRIEKAFKDYYSNNNPFKNRNISIPNIDIKLPPNMTNINIKDIENRIRSEKEIEYTRKCNEAYEDNRKRLREELEKKRRYKPISEYKPYNHGGKPNPITAINNLYNLKSTVNNNSTEYFREQQYINNSNSLYNTLSNNKDITHEDIVTIYNNPYLSTISNWSNIPTHQKDIIKEEYPEIENISLRYQEVKKGWSDTVLNVLKGTTEVLNTINSAVQKVLDSPLIDWGIAITAVASTIACPPAGSATIPACTAVLTRRAVARLAPAASVLVAREIGRQVGKDATQLQREFNILYNKKHNNTNTNSNNGNNRHNGTNSNAGTSNNAPRAVREYKAGTSWDKMQPVNTSEAQRKFGKLNKQAFGGGELRTDGKYVYRFDHGHKTGKIHLEVYRERSHKKWENFAEADPETGDFIRYLDLDKRKLAEW